MAIFIARLDHIFFSLKTFVFWYSIHILYITVQFLIIMCLCVNCTFKIVCSKKKHIIYVLTLTPRGLSACQLIMC